MLDSADTELIKKRFRILIRSVHPDQAGDSPENQEKTRQLIEKYREALKPQPDSTPLHPPISYRKPAIEFFKLLNHYLNSLSAVNYSKKELSLLKNNIILEYNNGSIDELNWIEIAQTILKHLIAERLKMLLENPDEDFKLELKRKPVYQYFKELTGSDNFMVYRYQIHSHADLLISDLLSTIRKTGNQSLRNEFINYLYLVLLFCESGFSDLYYHHIKEEKK